MMALSVPRGRLRALLFFGIALVTVLLTMVGVAWADTPTSLPVLADPLSATTTISANQLAGFPSTPPTITSKSALVLDMDTGKVLYKLNPRAELPMASTTKMMTAVIVLENMDMNTQLTISDKAAALPELETWTKAGDSFTVEQLLYSMMVPSHNQAAETLAEGFPGGVPAFVARMNAKAAELGMTGTHYVNPHGLDAPGHYSTATDLATLAKYGMSDPKIGPTFRKLVSTREYSLQTSLQAGKMVLRTTNDLLDQNEWVIGVKTGETPNAGACLVAAGTKNGVTVMTVVMGSFTNGQTDKALCMEESRELLEYGLSQYQYATVLEKGAAIAQAVVPDQDQPLQIVAKDNVGKVLSAGQTLTARVVIDHSLVLPVKAGAVLGRVELSIDGQSVGSVDLVVSRSVGKLTLGTKIAHFFAGLFH